MLCVTEETGCVSLRMGLSVCLLLLLVGLPGFCKHLHEQAVSVVGTG